MQQRCAVALAALSRKSNRPQQNETGRYRFCNSTGSYDLGFWHSCPKYVAVSRCGLYFQKFEVSATIRCRLLDPNWTDRGTDGRADGRTDGHRSV